MLTIKTQVDSLADQVAKLKAEADLLHHGGDGLPDKRGLANLSQSIIAKQA